MVTKKVRIGDFLTDKEIQQALRLYHECEAGTFAQRCADEIISPVLPRINKALGQENDAKYLAYCCAYVFMRP